MSSATLRALCIFQGLKQFHSALQCSKRLRAAGQAVVHASSRSGASTSVLVRSMTLCDESKNRSVVNPALP